MRNIGLLVTLVAVGCGGNGPAESCTTVVCGVGGKKIYQVCSTSGSTRVRYTIGSAGCACDASTCSDCESRILSYCSGDENGSQNVSCLAGGESCQAFSQCCSGTCAQQVCTSCGAAGQMCAGEADCCGGLLCYRGVCGSCSNDGAACNLASDCCSNICQHGVCASCTAVGGACTSSAECCDGVACSNGVCGTPDVTCPMLDANDCGLCCQNNYGPGLAVYNQIATGCLCQPDTCQTACAATICNPTLTDIDDPCATCWNGTTCDAQLKAGCAADASCTAFLNCFSACPTQ